MANYKEFSSIEEIEKALERLKDKEDFYCEYFHIKQYLTSNESINNENPESRIQTGICICKMISQLNIDSIYGDSFLEQIVNFLTKELKNLNKKSEYYSQYFNLLKTINETKVFKIANEFFSQEKREEIYEKIFQVIFDIVDENPEDDLKFHMLEILKAMIEEALTLSISFLFNFFKNIIEPQKSSKKEACTLTKDLIQKTKIDLEPFFIDLVCFITKEGDEDDNIYLYNIAYDLRNSFPKVIYNLINSYVKFNITNSNNEIRANNVFFLGKMFSDSESTIVITEKELFSIFLSRVQDINVDIRLMVIRFCRKIILQHPEMRKITSKFLRLSQIDPDPNVRIAGITSMTKAIFEDIKVLEGNEPLQDFLKNVKTDVEFPVRETELLSMAIIFKKQMKDFTQLSPEVKKALLSFQTKVLYSFSTNKDIQDTILVEKIFRDYLVSWDLPTEKRMKRFFHLYCTLHPWDLKSFTEFQENKFLNRNLLLKWVNLITIPESREEIREDFRIMTKYKKGPMASMEFVKAFENHLKENPRLVSQLEKIVTPRVSCKEAIVAFNIARAILSETNEEFYEEFLTIIERGTSFIIDDESIKVLINLIFEALEDDLDPIIPGNRGLNLLEVLVKYFSSSFEFEEILERFINYLKTKNTVRRSLMISVLAALGKRKPLYEIIKSESILQMLISYCNKLAIEGTPKESKASIRCLKYAIPNFDSEFEEILKTINSNSTLTIESDFFLGSIVTLGHISIERSKGSCQDVENLMPEVYDFIKNRESSEMKRNRESDWCGEKELSIKERSCEEAIKCIGRWIYKLETDSETLQKITEDVFSFMNRHLIEPYSSNVPAKNRLRAKVASTILKICQREELRHSIPLQVFYDLSKLMNDKSADVTRMFVRKLIKGLKNSLPGKFLTNEFLGFFILAGKHNKEMLKEINSAFEGIIDKRNFFINYMMRTTENISEIPVLKQRLFEWLPEFSIVYALPILARDSNFTNNDELNLPELRKMEKFLWNFIKPLVEKSNFDCYHFFKTIAEKLQRFSDAHSSDYNEKLWILIELLTTIVNKRIKKSKLKVLEVEIEIPRSHYNEFEILEYNEYFSMRNNKSKKRKFSSSLV